MKRKKKKHSRWCHEDALRSYPFCVLGAARRWAGMFSLMLLLMSFLCHFVTEKPARGWRIFFTFDICCLKVAIISVFSVFLRHSSYHFHFTLFFVYLASFISLSFILLVYLALFISLSIALPTFIYRSFYLTTSTFVIIVNDIIRAFIIRS